MGPLVKSLVSKDDLGIPVDRPDAQDQLRRRAVARGRIAMHEQTVSSVAANTMKKGDVLGAARFAGVQAAKGAASYLPLCVPVLVRSTTVAFELTGDAIEVEAVVEAVAFAGAEMHALVAVTAAMLTIYDMCKSADRTMIIGPVALVERSGDPSTDWRRDEDCEA